MHSIITEVVISFDPEPSTVPDYGVRVRVEDEGAGPYLQIEAHNCGAYAPHKERAICIGEHEEIDQLAAELHKILKQAEGKE